VGLVAGRGGGEEGGEWEWEWEGEGEGEGERHGSTVRVGGREGREGRGVAKALVVKLLRAVSPKP
jgi:hypothetical protein